MDLFVWLQYTLELYQVKNYSVCYSRFSGMFPYLTMIEYSIWYAQNKLWYNVKTLATFSKI